MLASCISIFKLICCVELSIYIITTVVIVAVESLCSEFYMEQKIRFINMSIADKNLYLCNMQVKVTLIHAFDVNYRIKDYVGTLLLEPHKGRFFTDNVYQKVPRTKTKILFDDFHSVNIKCRVKKRGI